MPLLNAIGIYVAVPDENDPTKKILKPGPRVQQWEKPTKPGLFQNPKPKEDKDNQLINADQRLLETDVYDSMPPKEKIRIEGKSFDFYYKSSDKPLVIVFSARNDLSDDLAFDRLIRYILYVIYYENDYRKSKLTNENLESKLNKMLNDTNFYLRDTVEVIADLSQLVHEELKLKMADPKLSDHEKRKLKIDYIKWQLSQVKEIMDLNIQTVIDRGEKIEKLIDKTIHLEESAKRFNKSSQKLNKCCSYF